MESKSGLTKSLMEAREAKVSWHRIAEVLREALGEARDRARTEEVLREAHAITHLKPLVLKRLIAIAERLDRVSRREGIPSADLALPSYNAVELALRLYDRDREAGLRAIEELRQGKTTIAELQRRVLSLPAGSAAPAAAARSAALARRAETIRICRTAIASYVGGEFGRRARTTPRPAMRHFHRLGFEVSADGRILAGVDLHLPDAPQFKDSDGLARSLLLARHLPLFVLAIAAASPGPAKDPAAGAEARSAAARVASDWRATTVALGMEWVGILTIDGEGAVEELFPPAPNPAYPDGEVYAAAKALLAGAAPGGVGRDPDDEN